MAAKYCQQIVVTSFLQGTLTGEFFFFFSFFFEDFGALWYPILVLLFFIPFPQENKSAKKTTAKQLWPHNIMALCSP